MIPDHIRFLIEGRFGKKIAYSKDCEALAYSIEKVCVERISPTTLKRLFGFAKSIDQPRTYTLDLLANYVGFIDWSTLLAKVEQASSFSETEKLKKEIIPGNHVQLFNHQIAISLTTESIHINSVIDLCKRFGNEPEIFPFLTAMISIAAGQKNIQFLSSIYSFKNIFTSKTHHPLGFYYIGQTMGLMMRRHNDISDELIIPLASNVHAQKYFIEWFVDEDHLHGYYGKLLDAYYLKVKKTAHSNLFYYCLKYKQCYQIGDAVQQNKWFKKLNKIKLTEDFHPIPAGRQTGIAICELSKTGYNIKSNLYQNIVLFAFKKEYDHAIGFLLYICRELFSRNRMDWMISIINEFELHHGEWEIFNRTNDHWGIKIENQLRIYAAYSSFISGNIKTARHFLSKIDPNLFEPFIYKQIHHDYIKVLEAIKTKSKI